MAMHEVVLMRDKIFLKQGRREKRGCEESGHKRDPRRESEFEEESGKKEDKGTRRLAR